MDMSWEVNLMGRSKLRGKSSQKEIASRFADIEIRIEDAQQTTGRGERVVRQANSSKPNNADATENLLTEE